MDITIRINGTEHATGASTVADLIAELGLPAQTVAVEVNGAVVPRVEHGTHPLAAGDVLELVSFVGGG